LVGPLVGDLLLRSPFSRLIRTIPGPVVGELVGLLVGDLLL
jgi:hypothetical protein